MTRLLFIFTVILTLTASCNRTDNKSISGYSVDTTTSFQIDNFRATPKKSFAFNSLGKSYGDTLQLVTCSQYVYFPFGKLTDKSSLSTSLLKDFVIVNFKRDTFTNKNINQSLLEWNESMDLQLEDNYLNLFLDNDPESSMHGYIRGGQIVDSKVSFSDNIRVGISAKDFYGKFFEHFPTELINKYKVIQLESCVTDVLHIYTFNNGKLRSVKFISQ